MIASSSGEPNARTGASTSSARSSRAGVAPDDRARLTQPERFREGRGGRDRQHGAPAVEFLGQARLDLAIPAHELGGVGDVVEHGPATTVPTSWPRNSNEVTTPKLPPPPRSAQNRSGCSSALAVTNEPSASTTSADSRLSIVSPNRRVR